MLWCRWFNQLCPTLKREPFSQQEDLLVVQVSRPQAPWPQRRLVAPAVNPSTLGSHLKHLGSPDGCSYPGMAALSTDHGCVIFSDVYVAPGLQAHARYGNQWALIAKLPGLEGR